MGPGFADRLFTEVKLQACPGIGLDVTDFHILKLPPALDLFETAHIEFL
jgi:hypothetical protein